ncbi:ImmA/IrrE family metallo-endopeptidase [Metabacillus idriensis]|uniref:ImmA/IrrE family metallo-endopeptidase n=1 Tax=Metabacillus idriensis TaxID=324768 RepID=UPI00203DBCCE|nr:ImmA/IrrE family metallo-endopeptidase [Metabacillus idriensis]MCM3594179.1 ImmA/IrrE family metallo-endopeptidase [Metabacillus idriensis]
MRIPRKPRYRNVHTAVREFLETENIDRFPIDPFHIIAMNGWNLTSYSALAEMNNLSIKDVIIGFQSMDGYVTFSPMDGYSIAYNDQIGSEGRIRFTLMHEVGHIYMKHLIDFEQTLLRRSKLNHNEYTVLEEEANVFARNALAPALVVKGLECREVKDLKEMFILSNKAADVRLNSLENDLKGLEQSTRDFFSYRYSGFIAKNKKQFTLKSSKE